MTDEEGMRFAIEQANQTPQFPFGSAILKAGDDEPVASGFNRGRDNPTWHGEIVALNNLFALEDVPAADRLSLFTTAEPCPMCMSAILWSGIGRVVYGTSIETLKRLGWDQIDIRARAVVKEASFANCQVVGGILESACDQLFVEANEN